MGRNNPITRKIYFENHKEEIKAWQKAYRETHKEECVISTRKYREANKEKVKAQNKIYRETNKERLREKTINAPGYLENARAYYHAHQEVISKNTKMRRWKLRLEVLAFYGNKCVCCGESNPCFLSIDHINGNGNKHRKAIGNGNICRWLKANNYPSGFQVLCYNCNMAKEFLGTCPHQLENGGKNV